jgi:Holin of 3TMs, for gene-transfer release
MADLTGLGSVADLAKDVIGRIWPNKTEQEKAELQAAMLVVQGQLQVNQVEAASSSVFVAGWRPFIGWVCGSACAWNWIGLPMTKAGLLLAGMAPLTLAPADLTEMLPVLMGMLGLGALRTTEKIKGVAR